ncbi:MAG: radical SAM protein [Planctomycetota bacterium]
MNKSGNRLEQLWDRMNPCTICPRLCNVHRGKGETGFCGIGETPLVSSVGPHFGEESVLVGRGGSGTIFFAGCNLGCVFCQNYDISHERRGRPVTVEQLAQSMLELQNAGCVNINFVTPTHVIAAIAAALELTRDNGLTLPTVYNTGGYDSVDGLQHGRLRFGRNAQAHRRLNRYLHARYEVRRREYRRGAFRRAGLPDGQPRRSEGNAPPGR